MEQKSIDEAKLTKLTKVEKIIGNCEVHVRNYVDSFRAIRDEKLYEAKGFTNFATYCAERWGRSPSAIHLAIQVDEIKSELQSSGVQSDQETRALVDGASENVIVKLAKVKPEKRVEVLKAAAAATNGKPTGAAVAKEIAKRAHKATPEPIAFGAFSNRPVDTGAYTSAPRPTEPTADAFGGDEDEPDEDAFKPVTCAASAAARLEAIYQRDIAWFNAVPQPLPRFIIDRFKAGIMEEPK